MPRTALADELRSLRLRVGLSQQAAADTIGLDRTVLVAYETGRHVPRPERLARIRTLYESAEVER